MFSLSSTLFLKCCLYSFSFSTNAGRTFSISSLFVNQPCKNIQLRGKVPCYRTWVIGRVGQLTLKQNFSRTRQWVLNQQPFDCQLAFFPLELSQEELGEQLWERTCFISATLDENRLLVISRSMSFLLSFSSSSPFVPVCWPPPP